MVAQSNTPTRDEVEKYRTTKLRPFRILNGCVGLIVLALVLSWPATALGQLEVDEQIDRERDDVDDGGYHLGRGWLDLQLEGYDRFITGRDDLDFYFYYYPMFQAGRADGETRGTFNQKIGSFFTWIPVRTPDHQGSLKIWIDWSTVPAGAVTKDFSRRLGLEQLVNDNDAKRSKLKLAELYWQSELASGRLKIDVGQMDPYLHLILNDYAYWDRENGFAQALATDVVTALGDPGIGALVFATARSGLYLGGGFVDADANGKYPDMESLAHGKFVYTAEVGWTGEVTAGKGEVRLNYANAPTKQDFNGGESCSLSASLDISPAVALWLRAAHAPRPSQEMQSQLAGGIVIKGPFGWESDRILIGVGRTRPTDRTLRDETVIEAQWRLQLTARWRLSPNLQLYLDPARDESRSTVLVPGVRMFVKF